LRDFDRPAKISLPSGLIIHCRYNATLPSVLVVENFLLVVERSERRFERQRGIGMSDPDAVDREALLRQLFNL
jgi:hypothetical protein